MSPTHPPLRWRLAVGAAATATVLAVASVSPAPPAGAHPGGRTIVAGTGLAGSSGDAGPAVDARIRSARAVEVLPDGSYVIADELDHKVRVVTQTPTGAVISTLVGTGTAGFAGDGGPAEAARLRRPRGVAADGAGNVYIADAGNNRVRRVSPSGTITTVAGTGVAGWGGDGGPATSAKLSSISGLAVDSAGNLYIADSGNRRVRKVAAGTGVISTVVGNGLKGTSDTDLPATVARLAYPVDVDIDAAGSLYVVDEVARRVVKVDPSGWLTTLAGNGTGGTVAWRPALDTGLAGPTTVETDPSGDSVLVGTEEGVYSVSGVGRIARAADWGEDAPAIPDGTEVTAIAIRPSGDTLIGVGASVQSIERPSGHVSGVVRTEVAGAFLAVPGAKVELLDPLGVPVTTQFADARGRYDITAPVGQWNLRFTAPGFAPFEFLGQPGSLGSGVRVPVGGSVTQANPFLDFATGAGASVVGRVTAPNGTNPDSTLTLRTAGGTVVPASATDRAGRFLFAGLPAGTYSLQVVSPSPWADGWWSPFVGLSATPVAFTVGAGDVAAAVAVPRAQFALSGQVTDATGAPVRGTIVLSSQATGEPVAEATIAADGTYRVPLTAPVASPVILSFRPRFDDSVHLPEYLGGMVGESAPFGGTPIVLGKVDVTQDVVLRTPAI